jgi:hypothetical protein
MEMAVLELIAGISIFSLEIIQQYTEGRIFSADHAVSIIPNHGLTGCIRQMYLITAFIHQITSTRQ